MAAIDADPVALRVPRMVRFFTGVMRRQMHRGFRAARVLRPGLPELPEGAPLVIYSNHPSWWDPAFYIVLADTYLPDRAGYGPIEAAMLEKYGFFARIGLFGVEPGTRAGAVRFLKVGAHVLAQPGTVLALTAQGAFTDPRERPVRLRAGLAHLLARTPDAVAVPLAYEYPFWNEKRPEALAAFGAPQAGERDAEAWQGVLERALEETQDALAAAARARDPAAFETILGGARGVGGVYGAWSRLKAAAGGRTYDPDHDPNGPDRQETRA